MKWVIGGVSIGGLFFGIFAVLATLFTYLVFQPLQDIQPEGFSLIGFLLLFPLILLMVPYGATSSFFLSPFEIKVLGNNFDLINSVIGVAFFALLGAVLGGLIGFIIYIFIKLLSK